MDMYILALSGKKYKVNAAKDSMQGVCVCVCICVRTYTHMYVAEQQSFVLVLCIRENVL